MPGRRSLLPLYAAGFVTAFGAHAVAANLAGYGRGRHVSFVELGVLLAVYDGAEVVLKPVFGTLADRVGAKPVLLGGLIGFALASAAFVVAGEPGFLGVARLAQGAAAAAFSPAAGALVAAAGAGGGRGRSFGGYGAAKGLGYLAGPIGGGLLVASGGYQMLFAALAVLAVTVAVWAARGVAPIAPTPRQRETLVGLARRLGQGRFVRPVVVLAAATGAFSAGVGFLPVIGARAGLGPVATGAAVSVLAASAALVQPRVGRALDAGRLGPGAASAGLALAAAGLAVAAIGHGPVVVVVAGVLVGVGVGGATPLGFAALAAAAPAGRLGQTMGAGEVGRELGDAGGPLLVGALSPAGLAVGIAGLAGAVALAALSVCRAGSIRGSTRAPS
jgi:MFS family permease